MGSRIKTQKPVVFICLAAVFAACLCACGGFDINTGKSGAISGGAVSGAAVEQRTDKAVSGHRFANTTNFYMEIPSEDEYDEDNKLGLLQYKLDGTKMQTLRIKDFDGLISVEEEGVIYSRWSGKDEYKIKICRIPLVKGEDGDQKLDLEKEEVIYTTKEEIAYSGAERYVYIDDQDIVYISAREKEGSSPEMTLEVVRYDREKKKEIPLKEQLECSAEYVNALILAGSYNRKLIFSNEEKGLYCLDLDTEELDLIRKGKDIFRPDDIRDEAHTVSGRNLIYKVEKWGNNGYCVQKTLYRYDLEEKEEDVLVSEPEVQEAVLKQGLVQGGEDTIQNIELTNYFVQGDRLYLQYQLNEDNGQEMRARYVILYKSISQNSELVCENVLTESLMKNSDSRRGSAEWYDEADKKRKKRFYEQNVGRCLKMVNGKAILFFLNVEEEKFEFGCYDLDSGKLKEISRQDVEWYEAYYDERNAYWYWWGAEDDWEYSYEGLCSSVRDGFMSWTPAKMAVDWE